MKTAAIAIALLSSLIAPVQAGGGETCDTALHLGNSTSTSILLQNVVDAAHPLDYFRRGVFTGYDLDVRTQRDAGSGHVDLRLWNADCTLLLAESAVPGTSDEMLTWTNGGTEVEVTIEVSLEAGGGATTYRVQTSSGHVDCTAGDDSWEPNDTCGTATELDFPGGFFINGRIAQAANDDFLRLHVPAHSLLRFRVGYNPSSGNIDAELYSDGCGTLLETSNLPGDELFEIENPDGTERIVVVRVFTTDLAGCVPYAVHANLQIGTNYCVSSPNSTGVAAQIFATGSTSSTAYLEVGALGVPGDQPGLFFYGSNQIQLPFGNGTRCVGGSEVFRLPPEISLKGVLVHTIDTGATSGSGALLPGSTWNFQAWFRDPAGGGAGFDLSDGLVVTFGP